MSFTTEDIINDINEKNVAAYDKIEEAVKELYYLGVAESAILLSVRIMYNEITEGLNE